METSSPSTTATDTDENRSLRSRIFGMFPKLPPRVQTDGDRVRFTKYRHFVYRSRDDFDIRYEDEVFLYRIRASPEAVRDLFRIYIERINSLADRQRCRGLLSTHTPGSARRINHQPKLRAMKHPMPSLTLVALIMAVSSVHPAKAAQSIAAATRPNVLILFTDDQRADTIHTLGNPHIRTPNIDTLVRNGLLFTNAYIMGGSSPGVCLPARASLLSGRTLWNIDNQGIWGYEISEKNKTLPEVFRENGYASFATGKNDPGKSGQFGRAYTHGDKLLFQGMSQQYRLPLHSFRPDGDYSRSKPEHVTGTHSAEVYADAAIRFLESRAGNEQPFYAYVAFQTPHDPRQSPEEFRKLYQDEDMPLPASFMPEHPFDNGMLRIRDEDLAPFPRTPETVRKHIADYYAVMTHTDAQIGRILESLEKSGKRDNTIIVFASDNGLALGRHGLMGKQNIYEHSVRVPMVIAGPGIPRGGKRGHLSYLYDIYPTLCEVAGLEIPGTVEFKSLMPVIRDAAANHRDHLYFAFMSWQRSVRDERYKLIEYCVDGTRHTQLFDLQKDPEEISNLAAEATHRPTLERLRNLLMKERLLLNDGNTPFPFTDKQGKDFWAAYMAAGETDKP